MSSEPSARGGAFESLFREHYERLCELVNAYVRARDTGDLTDDDLRGVTGTATLRLGWF